MDVLQQINIKTCKAPSVIEAPSVSLHALQAQLLRCVFKKDPFVD